jgi:hypothetical protein
MKNLIFILLFASFSAPRPIAQPIYSRTLADVRAFLVADRVSEEKYTEDHNCIQFTQELVTHARDAGFLAMGVGVDWNADNGHEIAVFYTTDYHVVYVEPQSDDYYFAPEIGGYLCNTLGQCYPNKIETVRMDFNP